MKSSLSGKILHSVVALGCCVGSALGIGANTLVNAKTDIILENVPECFKKQGIGTLKNLYSYVNCISDSTDGDISDGALKFYVESLRPLFPNDVSFCAAKKKLPDFDSFIYALGETMNKYTWAYYGDEKKSKNSEEQTWVRQRGTGIADGLWGRWGYERVDDLTRGIIRMWLEEKKIWR